MLVNKTNSQFIPYLIKGTDSDTGQNVGMLTLIDSQIDLYKTETKLSYPIDNSNCRYNGT